MTKVVNVRHGDPYDIYGGRLPRTIYHLGNPASHLEYGLATVRVFSREDAIQFHIDWLDGRHPEVEPERLKYVLSIIPTLKDKTIGCHCSPLPCHCDEYARRADKEAA